MAAKIEEVIRRLVLPEIQKIIKGEVTDLRTAMDERFKAIDERFNAIDERFKGMDDRLKGVDARLNTLSNQITDLRTIMAERFKGIDDRLNGVHDRILGLREAIETLKFIPRLVELERKVAALEIKATQSEK